MITLCNGNKKDKRSDRKEEAEKNRGNY